MKYTIIWDNIVLRLLCVWCRRELCFLLFILHILGTSVGLVYEKNRTYSWIDMDTWIVQSNSCIVLLECTIVFAKVKMAQSIRISCWFVTRLYIQKRWCYVLCCILQKQMLCVASIVFGTLPLWYLWSLWLLSFSVISPTAIIT